MTRQYTILEVFLDSLKYVLDLSKSMNILNYFHSSLLSLFISNDDELFLSRCLEMPGPIITEDGQSEYFINYIINK